MLVRHGRVAAEAWWTPYEPNRPHMLYSLSKSFTSTAVGLAVAEGRLSVQDAVISFFLDELPARVSENLAAMRVKHLLTMSTGHATEPIVDGDDNWVRAFLAAPVEHAPGTHFLYNTSATHVLSAIVQKLTGQRLVEYLGPRLFEPLAIEGATWEQSPTGIDIGGYGLSLKTEDVAKFGQLYLQKGRWNDRQIVPESWVAEATGSRVSNGDSATDSDWTQGYGYQFWRCRHGHYRGDGAFGQFCIVMPGCDAVLAITSGVGNMSAVTNAAWTHLMPAMSDRAVSNDRADELTHRLAALSIPPPAGEPTAPTVQRVSGRRWRFEPNGEGLESATLRFDADRCTITRTSAAGTETLVCGTHAWIHGTAPWGPVASRGAWQDERTFVLKLCFIETPYEWSETWRFEDDGRLTIDGRKLNVSFGPTARPPLRASIGGGERMTR